MAVKTAQYKKVGDFIPKTGWKDFDAMLQASVTKPVMAMSAKAKIWAGRVQDDWKEKVPVDTGNLRDSIDIEDHLDEGYILVGVNENKLLGPKTLRSTKVGKWGGVVRHIPPYNYVPAAEKNAKDVKLRFFVEKIWFEMARQRAEELFK